MADSFGELRCALASLPLPPVGSVVDWERDGMTMRADGSFVREGGRGVVRWVKRCDDGSVALRLEGADGLVWVGLRPAFRPVLRVLALPGDLVELPTARR